VPRLPPLFGNVGKRLVKLPADCVLVHSLLGLPTLNDALGHPVAGSNWEEFVIEMLIAAAPDALANSAGRPPEQS
jgi:hypothetical protein